MERVVPGRPAMLPQDEADVEQQPTEMQGTGQMRLRKGSTGRAGSRNRITSLPVEQWVFALSTGGLDIGSLRLFQFIQHKGAFATCHTAN